jgi:FKBP-type peptidyl-prolyl cis-trans isomerase
VLYKGTLLDGTVFDKNENADSPFEFTLGVG